MPPTTQNDLLTAIFYTAIIFGFVVLIILHYNVDSNGFHYTNITVNSLNADPLNNKYYIYTPNGSFITESPDIYSQFKVGYSYTINYTLYYGIAEGNSITGYTGYIVGVSP